MAVAVTEFALFAGEEGRRVAADPDAGRFEHRGQHRFVADQAGEPGAGVFGVADGGAVAEAIWRFAGEVERQFEFFADGLELFEDPRRRAFVTLGRVHGSGDAEQVADGFAWQLVHRIT